MLVYYFHGFAPAGALLITDYQLPFRLVVGPALLHNEAAQSPLTAPFWLAPDPDAACLCWRNVPLSISKWEIKDHLTVCVCVCVYLIVLSLLPRKLFIVKALVEPFS